MTPTEIRDHMKALKVGENLRLKGHDKKAAQDMVIEIRRRLPSFNIIILDDKVLKEITIRRTS